MVRAMSVALGGTGCDRPARRYRVVVETSTKGRFMALSDDAVAIVASNLAAAYCTLVKGMVPVGPDDAGEAVHIAFQRYLRELRLGEPIHPERSSE